MRSVKRIVEAIADIDATVLVPLDPKIDVDGFELDVLAGMPRLLAENPQLTLPDRVGARDDRPCGKGSARLAKTVRCAACDELGAQVAYRFPDGRILRFRGRCYRIWEDECQRVPRSS